MPIGDQVGKPAADEVVSAIPALETFVDAQLAKLQNTLEAVVGGTLADITVERTQTVNQLADVLHAVLDRLNGTAVVLGHGASPYGFTLVVPDRNPAP